LGRQDYEHYSIAAPLVRPALLVYAAANAGLNWDKVKARLELIRNGGAGGADEEDQSQTLHSDWAHPDCRRRDIDYHGRADSLTRHFRDPKGCS
jgi:hypothetical protein